jgi:hypothetical protein
VARLCTNSNSSSRINWSASISSVFDSVGLAINGKICNSRAEQRAVFAKNPHTGTNVALKVGVHATFFQKVFLCAFVAFLAAALIQWAKVFVEGADDALNKGYQHRAVFDPGK